MSGMAEVLAAHSYYEYQKNLGYYRSEYLCECGATFWAGDHEGDPALHQAVAAHHAAMLTAAGFGPVKEAKAEALEDVDNYVDEVMFHSDTATNTGPLVAGRGPLISLLRERAAALRAGAATKQDAEATLPPALPPFGDREYRQAQWDHSRTPERYGGGLG